MNYRLKRKKKENINKKKLNIRKNYFHNSLNDSKKDMIIKREVNSSLNDKIKSYNHNNDKYKSIEDIFYQTYIDHNYKHIFPFPGKNKENCAENEKNSHNNNNNENKNKDDEIELKPFDLNLIFGHKLNYIKDIIIKELKTKKWKYSIKKNKFFINKNECQIEFNINKLNDNIFIIKAVKRTGNYQLFKDIIRYISSKLK